MTAPLDLIKTLTDEVNKIGSEVKRITASIKAGKESEAEIQQLAELQREFPSVSKRLMAAVETMMKELRKRKLS